MSNTRKYYFARLNLLTASSVDKSQYVQNSIRKHGLTVEEKGICWGFLDTAIVRTEGAEYLVSNLTRYLKSGEEAVAQPDLGVTGTANIDNKISAQSRFFMNVPSGLIAFHADQPGISERSFRSRFARLIEKANDGLFVNAEVQLIQNEGEIIKAIRSFDSIHRVRITLHPSNPRYRHIWAPRDQALRRLDAEEYLQDIKSRKGLNIDDEADAYKDILMAGDGYGVAVITGRKDGKTAVASTEKVPMTTTLQTDLALEETAAALEKSGFLPIKERIDSNDRQST